MRCVACDKIMTDYELTKKFSSSGEFVDMCNECSDLEEIRDVEHGTLDYDTGTEQGDEDEWT